MSSQENTIVFDDIFDYIGGEGLFQITYLVIMCCLSFCSAEVIYSNFFGASMDHWCNVPSLMDWPYEIQKKVAIPSSDLHNRAATYSYSSCEMFDLNYSALSNEDIISWNRSVQVNDSTETLPLCPNGWVYDKSEFTSTIISEWNLVCNDSIKVSLVSTIYIAGMLFGAIATGIISDGVGRKPTIMICILIKVIGGMLSTFAPDYASMMIARFLTGFGSHGVNLTSFVILMEVSSPKARTVIGVSHMISFSIGYMIAPAISYFVRDFRTLLFIQTVPSILGWLIWWFGPESPRWLIVKGRYNEAMQIIKLMADVNGREVPGWLDISRIQIGVDNEDEAQRPKRTVLDLFKRPLIRKWTLVIYLHWFTDSLVYYVFSFNAGNITSSVFLNTFLMGAVEIPANILAIVCLKWHFLGRKWTSSHALTMSGLASFIMIPLVITRAVPVVTMALALVAKAGGRIGFSAIYVYSGEIFPTEVRNVGLGSSSLISRISGMAAPFIANELGKEWKGIPFVLCGIFGIVSGILTLILPETLNKPLPQTIEQAETLGDAVSKRQSSRVSATSGSVQWRSALPEEGDRNPVFDSTRL